MANRVESVQAMLDEFSSINRDKAMKAVLVSRYLTELRENLLADGVSVAEIKPACQLIMEDAGLLKTIIGKGEESCYRLGLIAAFFSHTDLPGQFNDLLLNCQPDNNFTIQVNWPNWRLCHEAEPRMKQAVSEGGAIMINDSIVVKLRGRLSGIAVNSFSTGRSTFIAGNWYAPADDNLRSTIRSAFDEGKNRLELAEGKWVLIRSVVDAGLMRDLSGVVSNPLLLNTALLDQTPGIYQQSVAEDFHLVRP